MGNLFISLIYHSRQYEGLNLANQKNWKSGVLDRKLEER